MVKLLLLGCLALAFCACTSQPASGPATGLRKVRYRTPEELQKLRDAGVDIVVQQSNYVIVRVDSTKVTALAAVPTEAVQERDLVQRLVHIKIDSTHVLQQVADAGLDVWEVQGDTVVARAYDLQLERLRQAGFTWREVAQDADQMKGK